jgi:23S rRNA (guanine2445-N2)-methyltransferase / 23S rRNA (guanine2069-N7)-methyltransferase
MINNKKVFQFFATTPKGLELLLVDELRSLGATNPAEKLAGVTFSGDLELAYKVCLWSRLANRVLLPLAKFAAATPEELYAGVQSIDWHVHLNPTGTLAVHFVTTNSAITHTLFGAQKIKDAVVDQFRDKYNERPNVDREQPDVQIYAYLNRDLAEISIDLSGESLHKRGYRLAGGSAPLKENLAAAILIRAGWPAVAKQGGSLMDPMCGSGTLLTEAALMAGDIAPGLLRDYFGFLGWKQHQPSIWDNLLKEASVRREYGLKQIPDIIGYDRDALQVKNAFHNIQCAGLSGYVHVEKRELAVFEPKKSAESGLVVTNPPYGERLGEEAELAPLYALLGTQLKAGFEGWRAAVLTGNPDLGRQMGLHSIKQYALFNGPIPCKLLLFDLKSEHFIDRSPQAENAKRIRAAKRAIGENQSAGLQMFINRLAKNMKHRKKLAQRENASHFRVYDVDLPDYAFAIDVYPDKTLVAEYRAPKEIPAEKVIMRRQEVLSVLPDVLAVDERDIYYEIVERN